MNAKRANPLVDPRDSLTPDRLASKLLECLPRHFLQTCLGNFLPIAFRHRLHAFALTRDYIHRLCARSFDAQKGLASDVNGEKPGSEPRPELDDMNLHHRRISSTWLAYDLITRLLICRGYRLIDQLGKCAARMA